MLPVTLFAISLFKSPTRHRLQRLPPSDTPLRFAALNYCQTPFLPFHT
uniref:Uncharacterized protein n=1 Tax=Rhizophora mucronata TaxID=61149 RepID=A0A2P2JBY3_RHIMU